MSMEEIHMYINYRNKFGLLCSSSLLELLVSVDILHRSDFVVNQATKSFIFQASNLKK